MILDSAGKVVYYKVFERGANVGDFELQPNGLMSYSYRDTFYLMDSTFNIIDSVFCQNSIYNDRHDFKILPNGHFLLLGYEYKIMDLTPFQLKDSSGHKWGENSKVKCGVFQELDQNKHLIFEWHAIDHYAFADADARYFEGPGILDWTHFNAITCDMDGNYLLSVRNFNEITKVNRNDGSIIWRLGGKHNQFAFTNDTEQFMGQHDINKLANGDITLYDDGCLSAPFHPAGAKEYYLDEASHTANLTWAYREKKDSYTNGLGNVQRLNNGNTLISYGRIQNDSTAFSVVDSKGKKVFELAFEDNLVSYRVFNYLSLPWRLNRPSQH